MFHLSLIATVGQFSCAFIKLRYTTTKSWIYLSWIFLNIETGITFDVVTYTVNTGRLLLLVKWDQQYVSVSVYVQVVCVIVFNISHSQYKYIEQAD